MTSRPSRQRCLAGPTAGQRYWGIRGATHVPRQNNRGRPTTWRLRSPSKRTSSAPEQGSTRRPRTTLVQGRDRPSPRPGEVRWRRPLRCVLRTRPEEACGYGACEIGGASGERTATGLYCKLWNSNNYFYSIIQDRLCERHLSKAPARRRHGAATPSPDRSRRGPALWAFSRRPAAYGENYLPRQ
jgi:hypothetical protein